jgi:predicted P-loop ATPase/GTPase
MSGFVVPGSYKGEFKISKTKKQLEIQNVLDLISKDLNTGEYYTDRLTNFRIPVDITAKIFTGLLSNSQSLNQKIEDVLREIKQVITKNKISVVKENYILINENDVLNFLLENKDVLYFLESLPDILINYFDNKRKLSLEVKNDFQSEEKTLNILINTSDLSVDNAFQYLINFKTDFLLKKDNKFLRRIHINAT